MKISYEEAIAHRLRRVYLPLFSVLLGAWLFRILVIPDAGSPWPESAAIGVIPGIAVASVVGAFYLCLVYVTFRSRAWQASGELRKSAIGAWDNFE